MAPKIMRGNKEIQISPGPISGLSEEVIFEILVRISSVKTIALCKSVCKVWRRLISGPRFAELHLARSKICVLVRKLDKEETLRTVCLLEDEDGRRGFHSTHCVFEETETETERCEICRSDAATAITKLKIPVPDAKIMASTCDGFLCLYPSFEESPIVVCNPVTGEYVTLPDRDISAIQMETCGLGFDPKTGRYKVVVLYPLPTPISESFLKVEVHVLGTDSWRKLDTPDVRLDLAYLSGPALLGGTLYWVYKDRSSVTHGMVSFDLGSERLRYRSLPSPPLRDLAVAALEERLCEYPWCYYGKLDMCSVCDSSPDLPGNQACLQLLCRLDKELLMFSGPRFKHLRYAGDDPVEVVAYTPSFLSLKDIVRPGNAEVLNVYSME